MCARRCSFLSLSLSLFVRALVCLLVCMCVWFLCMRENCAAIPICVYVCVCVCVCMHACGLCTCDCLPHRFFFFFFFFFFALVERVTSSILQQSSTKKRKEVGGRKGKRRRHQPQIATVGEDSTAKEVLGVASSRSLPVVPRSLVLNRFVMCTCVLVLVSSWCFVFFFSNALHLSLSTRPSSLSNTPLRPPIDTVRLHVALL
jgi:hypothetical protein